MASIFCQVLHRADRITFLWSEGAASFGSYHPFEPYHLEGAERAHLLDLAAQVHAQVAHGSAAELGRLGHQLYRALFRRDAGDYGAAEAVQTWLGKLIASNGIDKLELLSDVPGLIPWNVLAEEMAAGPWGARFNLAAGRRVNALRQNPTQVNPKQISVVDLQLAQGLTTGQQPLLESLRAGGDVVHTSAALTDSLAKSAPDVLLLLVRCEKGALHLGGESLSIGDLKAWLAEPKDGNPDPLVILAASGDAADQSTWQAILNEASAALSGLVANETLLPAPQAFAVGHAVAQQFAEGKQSIGEILRGLRAKGGAALAFSAFCPPQVRVAAAGAADAPAAELPVDVFPLPIAPYRPFAAFEASDRPLLFGREEDTLRGALATDQADANCVLVHGSPAVGKTSFLQAALLPYLEQECVGYRVLRDRTPLATPTAEKAYPILVLRCTNDLAGQFADAIAVFCAQPLTYMTPAGTQVTIDLPTLLQQAVAGTTPGGAIRTAIQSAPGSTSVTANSADLADEESPREPMSARELWIVLRDTKEMLGRILEAITRTLPFELVIAVDQGEELLTQVRTPQQQARRQKAIDMLVYLSHAAPRCKIIYAIRSQSLGEFASLFPDGQAPANWHPFYLRPLSESEMVDALLWPTNRAAVPYSDEVPFQKYGFSFEGAPLIVTEALEASAATQQAPLPILQAVGALLFEVQVQEKKQETLRAEDLKQFGGVKEALAKYLERTLERLPLTRQARNALRDLIGKLHTGHADGTVSRDLLPAGDLQNYWKCPSEPVEPIVNQASQEQGLFEIQELLIGGQADTFVSLPQDSLAQLGRKIAGEAERNAYARTKVIDILWIMIPLTFLAAAVSFWATRNFLQPRSDVDEEAVKKAIHKGLLKEYREALEDEVRQLTARTRRPLYFGQLAQADLAIRADNALLARMILKSQPAMLASADEKRFPELRGFEWKYLWRHLNSERHLLEGHAGKIHAVAISHDSQRVASASSASERIKDGTIRIWSLQTGELLALVPGQRSPAFAVAFSPDGKTLATAGADKIVRLWDISHLKTDYLEITKELKELPGHTDAVHALAFGKDSNTLASAGADRTIKIWDLATGKEKTLTEKDNATAIHALAFADDGKTIVSGGAEGRLLLWDAVAGKLRQPVKSDYQAIAALTVSADGKTLCSAGVETKLDAESGVLRFWNVADGKEKYKPIQHGSGVLSVAFAPDGAGATVASGGKDRVIRLWNVQTGKEQHKWIGHLGFIGALAFARDGSALVSGSHDADVKVWNPTQSSGPDVIAAHNDWVQALVLNRKNTLLASGSRDGAVKIWDPKTNKLIKELPKHNGAVTALAFSQHKDTDKIFLAVGTRDDKNLGEIKIWQIDRDEKTGYTFKERPPLKEHTKGITCLAFFPSNDKADPPVIGNPDLLVSGSADQTVKLWNLETIETSKKPMSYHGHKDEVRCIAFSFDGKSFASGGKDALVCFYDIDSKDGKDKRTLAAIRDSTRAASDLHANSIEAIALFAARSSADEHHEVLTGILTASADQSMQVFGYDHLSREAVGKAKWVRTFRSHAGPISSVLQTDDNNTAFISAGWDGAIKIYDRENERFTLTGHQGAVRAIAFAADQSFLASAGNDGTIRIWRTHPERAAAKGAEKKKAEQ